MSSRTLFTFLCSSLLLSQIAAQDDVVVVNDLAIKPLPALENKRPQQLETADALLSDWEGEHFAALDADQDKVALSWTTERDIITCQVQVTTKGWFSIGLTFRGSLIGADFLIGWISTDGNANIIDANGNQFGQMMQDKSQDYELIVGYEYQESTVIRFKRKLNTCDGEDLAITNDTIEIHWSYALEDPDDTSDLSLLVPERSGVRSLHFFGSSSHHKPRSSTLTWTVQSNSVKLEPSHTVYWCTMTKLPELPGKHHMVGYKPILRPDTEQYIHHMMLYECHDEDSDARFSSHVHSGYECNTPNMPDDFRKCRGIVAAWGLGGDDFYFPPEAGYPVGEEHGGATYYMLEIHYDNPGLHDNITDDSGLEILLTPQLRKFDSSLLTIGHEVSSLHLIPPGLEHFTSVGHCPDLCTQSLSDEGIHIFAGFPHTHSIGSAVRLRHLRNGVERPVPFEDRFYNPNYQTMRGFELHLMPNDHLMIECTYNSSNRNGYTHGGYSAQNEMCLAFLHYYPASRLAHCTSRLSFKHILLAMGVNVWPLTPTTRNFGLRIRDPWQYQNLTFFDYLKVAASKDDTTTNLKLQEASLHHSHKADCFDYGRRRIFADGVEFSTPRIMSPVYDLSSGCFSSGDIYDFDENLRLNQPLKSSTTSHRGTYAVLITNIIVLYHLVTYF